MTQDQKKQRKAQVRRQGQQRPFEQKESFRWVEALKQVNQRLKSSTKVIHIFDREGDIAEVFEKVRHLEWRGVIVRATHDRSLDKQSERLWMKLEAQSIDFSRELELPATSKRAARNARIAVRFCEVDLRTPHRFEDKAPLKVYAVYAHEVDVPEGETPLSWMLSTTEAGFLSIIAVELFELIYLHRTQPELPIESVLNSTRIAVLKARS